MKQRIYTGDIDGVAEHFQFQAVKNKDGSDMETFNDYCWLFRHIKDNTNRKDNREKIIKNDILENEVIGDIDGLIKKYEKMNELQNKQRQINKQAGHKKKEIVCDCGRGKFIPARTGVIQLTLDPRNPKNKEAILKWKQETIKNIQELYGKDTIIAFHFNETSCGAHFIKDFTELEIDDSYCCINRTKRQTYCDTLHNSNQIIDVFHQRNKQTVKQLAEEFDLKFVDGPVMEYSQKRKEKDFVKIAEAIERGEKLSWKQKRILRKYCIENNIDLGEKQIERFVDEVAVNKKSLDKIEKLRTQLLYIFKDWSEEDVKNWAQMKPNEAVVDMIKNDIQITKETDEKNKQLEAENESLKYKNQRLEQDNKKKTIETIRYVDKPVEKIVEKEVRSKKDIETISNLENTIIEKNQTINELQKTQKTEEEEQIISWYRQQQQKQQRTR